MFDFMDATILDIRFGQAVTFQWNKMSQKEKDEQKKTALLR